MALGQTFTYDDGSTLTVDGSGAVLGATDINGNPVAPPPAEGSTLVQHAAALFNYGIRAAIDARFRQQPMQAAPAASVPSLSQNLARFVPILLIAGIAIVAYKALK